MDKNYVKSKYWLAVDRWHLGWCDLHVALERLVSGNRNLDWLFYFSSHRFDSHMKGCQKAYNKAKYFADKCMTAE